jgi:mannosylglycerate hydrolase
MEDTSIHPAGQNLSVLDSSDRERRLVVISHTHWDREWHRPYQEFRLLLTKAVDGLLAILASDSEYRHFLMDGQTVVLEDYLEMRPERRAELHEHIASGRILVGPWYVLPDEFLVSGEALIRNLQIGYHVAHSFGQPMKVGYLPDQFGHISQMPQILRGFDIDSAVVWRGLDTLTRSEFRWRSPDGSEVLALHLPCGYFNAVALPDNPERLMVRLETIRSELEPLATTPYVALMNGGDHFSPQPSLSKVIEMANELLGDAQVSHGSLPEFVQSLRDSYRDNGSDWPEVTGELRQNRRYHLLPGVLSARMWIKQRNAACENLLEKWAEPFSAWASLEAAQSESATPSFANADSWRQPLRQAWKYLLQNQPHDSICGCSVDQVHEEMKTRFDWSEQISQMITREALTLLVGHVDTASLTRCNDGDEESSRIPLVVFNPDAGPRTGFVSFTTPVPAGENLFLSDYQGRRVPLQLMARRAVEPISFLIGLGELSGMLNSIGLDSGTGWSESGADAFLRMLLIKAGEDNEDVRVARLAVDPSFSESCATLQVDTVVDRESSHREVDESLRGLVATIESATRPFFMLYLQKVSFDEVEIGFVAREVPAHGYQTYQLLAGPSSIQSASATISSSNRLENEHLVVRVAREDGTLTIIDKQTGAAYHGLNRFVDGGDSGDEYNYDDPVRDTFVSQPTEPPAIYLEESGPARATLRVDLTLRLPRGLTANRQSRTLETVDCPISSFISVYPGVKRVDIHTEVDNRALDHRLRAHFPTSADTHHSTSEGHFEIIRRPTEPEPNPADAVEPAVRTVPQKTLILAADERRGLAIANRGLPEAEVMDTEKGAEIALTLLRSVGWLSRGDLRSRRGPAGPIMATPGAQCLGRQSFDYAVLPGALIWEAAQHEAHWFNNPMRVMSTGLHSGKLPISDSLVEVFPWSLVTSAIKVPEKGEGLIVRLYNPAEESVRGTIKLDRPFLMAELVNLEETSQRVLESGHDRVELDVKGRQIVTLKFTFPISTAAAS